MLRSQVALSAVSVLIFVAIISALHVWLATNLEFTPITITSSGKTIYFFDTQVITERIKMKEAARIIHLEIPWYPPTIDTPVVVDLRRDGKLVSRWHIRYLGDGSAKTLLLSFITPQYIDGVLDISFSAAGVNRQQLANAPRLLLEPLDQSFLSGNYRIGDEEKPGDIQMDFIGQRQRIDILRQDFDANPIRGMGLIIGFITMCSLIMALPHALYRGINR